MNSRIFDNLFFTRLTIKKVQAKNISLENPELKILFFVKKKDNYTPYDEDYYDRVSFLKTSKKTEIINIQDAWNYLNTNLEALKNKQVLIVGYLKSIAWIYRFLDHQNIKVKIIV